MKTYIPELFSFIGKSPTSAHAVQATRAMLEEAGFAELRESQPWALSPGGKYYVTRGLTSLLAFRYPGRGSAAGFSCPVMVSPTSVSG